MKNIIAAIAAFGLIILSSCNLTTLYPIFTEKNIISDNRLLGSWRLNKSPKDTDIIVISKVPPVEINRLPVLLKKIAGKGYLIVSKDRRQNVITRHLAFLVKIGRYHYLDYYPLETDEELAYFDFFKVHYIKMHSFYRVSFKNDQAFEIKPFDEGYIHRLIDNNHIRIRYEWQPYLTTRYIITASTEELQAYLAKYADDPNAYTQESIISYAKLP